MRPTAYAGNALDGADAARECTPLIDLNKIAAIVDEAARTGVAISQLSETYPELDVTGAYAIQHLSIQRRLARGEQRVGAKMGLTSRAKMRQMGVDQVIWGRLTDSMRIEEGGELNNLNDIGRDFFKQCHASCRHAVLDAFAHFRSHGGNEVR
jgi:hypothetical protein